MNRRGPHPNPPALDAADFTGVVFPEHAFPPPPCHADDHFAACRANWLLR